MADVDVEPSYAYARVRDELIAALLPLDAAATATTVPACPAWTVKDVVAHLCGLNAEKLAGVPGRLGTDEATTRQVADRATKTLGQVVDEWLALADPVGALMSEDPVVGSAFLADLVIHAYDIAEVLGQPTAAAAAATPGAARRYIAPLQDRVASQLGLALDIELIDDSSWPASQHGVESRPSLRATPHDFLRSVTGRRTRAQVEALGWSADPAPILDSAWNQYGPFRD